MDHTIVVADAHLESQNDELTYFLDFLATLHTRPIQMLYLLGDLFTIWLGTPKMQLAHQKPVIEALHKLRERDVAVKYVEGNRDYFLVPFYLQQPFTEIAAEYAQETIGKRRIYLAHGDLINVHDTPYRLWRRISRNRRLYAGFNCLPRAVVVRAVHFLEHTFRETNQRNKAHFPEKICETYACHLFQQGYDRIILGHFHEQRRQEFSIHGNKQELYVLPAWKDTHTYLLINDEGECAFQEYD